MRSNDRVFKMKKREEGGKGVGGLIDQRLFTGDNNLHAVLDPQTNLWSLYYEKGKLPPALGNVKFSQFGRLETFIRDYFSNRNVDLEEVIS